ncbi:MAG: hypothetical protein J2P57_20830, partial [Acidimicrobiaceae bacterium]|nr:hypothetical protein [Acidimicrobiaceae bacterium]
YCLSVRMEGGYDFGSDIEHVVTHFETSDLSDRQKAALRLAAAFLEVPSELSAEARAEAQKHFTTDEIIGLLLKLTSFLINKSRAALGIDGALDPEKVTRVVAGESVQKYLPQS